MADGGCWRRLREDGSAEQLVGERVVQSPSNQLVREEIDQNVHRASKTAYDTLLTIALKDRATCQTHFKIDATSMMRGMSREKPADDRVR